MSIGSSFHDEYDDGSERERGLEAEWEARGEELASEDLVLLQSNSNAPINAPDNPTEDHNVREHEEDAAVLGDTCPICLQSLRNASMLQSCYHVYCFDCLSSWVQQLMLHGVNPPTCPLCKARFERIYCNVVSEHEYDVMTLQNGNFHAETARRIQDPELQLARRRALVYRNQMQLVRINGASINSTALPVDHPIVKLTGEYSAWLQRELQACIGQSIDLTVLLALIDCSLDKLPRNTSNPSVVEATYQELEDTLRPFLYEDTHRLVRELAYFMASRLNMHAYDQVVEYGCTNSSQCSTCDHNSSVN